MRKTIPKGYNKVAEQDKSVGGACSVAAHHNRDNSDFFFEFKEGENSTIIGPVPAYAIELFSVLLKDLVWMEGRYNPVG